ncbi:Histidine transport system permease protein hisM [Nocardia africana]|uniref:Histidine/lysine/arginine/ornithine transport system permease protein HisM n=1 Tax=Nocardia africana TaxID=134964 RepID=A0A378WPP8_9NOCA|nr:Histidine transport system permease protein hisM [Nocardia africana]
MSAQPPAGSQAGSPEAPMPEPIEAVPLRRPGRWIAAAVLLILLGLFVYGAATNPAYRWDTYWKYLFDRRISEGAVVTLELTVLAMAIGVVLGVILAVMRLSPNPVLRSVSWVYLWIFRGTPVYIQLVFWACSRRCTNRFSSESRSAGPVSCTGMCRTGRSRSSSRWSAWV